MLESPVDHLGQSLYGQENYPQEVKELAQPHSVRQSRALGSLWDTDLSTLKLCPSVSARQLSQLTTGCLSPPHGSSSLLSQQSSVPFLLRFLLVLHPCVCGLKGLLMK